MTDKEKSYYKQEFKELLKEFTCSLQSHVSSESGEWTIKGFIDIYKNIYTISSDTKIVSKILEIHIFPQILKFAQKNNYKLVLAEKQNWYPDLTFISNTNEDIKFSVDLKTTYRNPDFKGHINGFTLGSHGTYFKNRDSSKNIQYPYSQYSGHFCLGIIYTRADLGLENEIEVFQVKDIEEPYDNKPNIVGQRQVTTIQNLKSIVSVIKDFQFFVAEKWEIASDTEGSKNTANIGSITYIEDLITGNGMFSKLGEEWFDEYWINYGSVTKMKDGKAVKISKLKDFLEFKGRIDLIDNIVNKNTKKKNV